MYMVESYVPTQLFVKRRFSLETFHILAARGKPGTAPDMLLRAVWLAPGGAGASKKKAVKTNQDTHLKNKNYCPWMCFLIF